MPREKRPCWKCGTPGHIGAQCTSGAARLVDHEAPPGATFALRYEDVDEEGFKLARKTVRPQKVPVTIASFIDINPFKHLESQKEWKQRNTQKVVKPCEGFKAECDSTLIHQSSFCACNSVACREPVPAGVVVQGRSGGTEMADHGGQSIFHQIGPTFFTDTEDVLDARETLAIAEHLYGGMNFVDAPTLGIVKDLASRRGKRPPPPSTSAAVQPSGKRPPCHPEKQLRSTTTVSPPCPRSL